MLIVMAALLFPRWAWAQSCSGTISSINFGNVTTNAQIDVTATVTVNCTGLLNNIMICPNFGAGSISALSGTDRQIANGSNLMQYQMYSNSARTTIWGSSYWAYTPRPPKMSMLTLLGSNTTTQTIYARLMANQLSKPAGLYSSSFAGVSISMRFSNDLLGLGNCNSQGGTQFSVGSFTVQANLPTNCNVSTGIMDFGSKGVLAANTDAQTNLSVTCTSGGAYTISLGNGGIGTSPTNRKMTKGSESVTYGLYTNTGRTTPWGTAAGATVAGTGSGAAQSYTVYGRVPPQATPSAGVYNDTVVVTVTY